MATLSTRLRTVRDGLPLRPGLRVRAVGCGPGALARAMAKRVAPGGHVQGIDRLARAMAQAEAGSAAELAGGILSYRQVAAEDFAPGADGAPVDPIVALRFGAFDGRDPAAGARAWPRPGAVLAPGGRVLVDGQDRSGRAIRP